MTVEQDWQHLLAAERRLQALVPGATLVGGTAVALHLHHRLSLDGDHVLADLRERFDEVLASLEATLRDGLRVPTLAELARIKSWLLVERDTVRDYVDVVAIFEALGQDGVRRALADFDETYARGPSAAPPSIDLVERLRAGSPADRDSIDLTTYKGIMPPWNDWQHVLARGRAWSALLARWSLSP
jgi:hypothetical protein